MTQFRPLEKSLHQKVLLITDYFPPDPGGRSEKMYRHIKYLCKKKIQADVLCPATKNSPINYKTPNFDCVCYRVKPYLWKTLPSLKWQDDYCATFYFSKLYLKLRLPSGYLRWIIPAYFFARDLIKNFSYTDVICVSNPLCNQLIGLLLVKDFKELRLISELRDPLAGYYRTRHHNFVNVFIERLLCKYSSIIIEWEDFSPYPFSNRHSKIADKVIRIKNVGYDPDEYTTYNENIQYNKKLKIVYTGGFYGEKDLWKLFFLAFSAEIEYGAKISFDYYGDWDRELQEIYDNLSPKVKKSITYHGKVSKDRCIIACEKSHVLFYIHGCNKENLKRISSKLYDYFAAKRPIFSIVPENSLAESKLRHYNPYIVTSISNNWKNYAEKYREQIQISLRNLYTLQKACNLESIINHNIIDYSCDQSERLFSERIASL